MDPREHRQVIDRMDVGRRMATTLLQRCDIGIPVEVAIRELAPTLSPAAVDAARKLAELTAFHFASTAMVLTGLVPDSPLEVAEIPEPPARPARRGPDEMARPARRGPDEIAAVGARRPGCPSAPVAPEDDHQ